MDQQMWSFVWALAALLLALSVYFLSKNRSRRISSQADSSGDRQQESSAPSLFNSALPVEYEVGSSSGSSSALPLPRGEYEVFLSFRGPDVRTHFADSLYQFLDTYGIRTFFDDCELSKGRNPSHELMKAIEESKIYIPIFSPDYASSEWCLWEVAHMLQQYKQGNGHIILPIFYLMEPTDVRHQKGSYEEAFERHHEEYGEEIVKEWREALQVVGRLTGWKVNQSDRQGAIIRDVFSRIRTLLTESYRLVTKRLVGIDPHVKQVTELLSRGSKVVGILGMGGLGKTTIAMATRDQVYAKFDSCCFLRDVRETLSSSKEKGIVDLQNQIISGILRSHDSNVQNKSEGIRTIRDRVCRQKVLIIIDDVDERFEFEQILGNLEDFSSTSRFIITTRDQRVLDFFQHELYIPKELDHDHSIQLFSIHAFGTDYPPENRLVLSEKVLKISTGLPLALQVIGSNLYRRSESFWEAKLKQLERIPPREVQERLKISYMDLTLEEQSIFLDIACFFLQMHKKHPFYMWSSCDLYPDIGVDTLVLKSMVNINEKNEFWMHDSIRDLGRTIVREQDLQCPWRRSRIWYKEGMLTNGEDIDKLEGMQIHDEYIELKKLSGLRYIEAVGGGLEGNLIGVLPNLRWLHLFFCNWIPDDLNMNKLVVLEMSGCEITDDWKGLERIKEGRRLKSVCFSECNNLKVAPDFSQCRDLEWLDLQGCTDMGGELHLGNCQSLKVLKINGTKITEITGDIGDLNNLQEIHALDLEFRDLPAGIGQLSSLEVMKLQLTESRSRQVRALPTSLKVLILSHPCISNVSDLVNLEELCFVCCDAPVLPRDSWKISKLASLTLGDSTFTSLLVEDQAGEAMGALPPSLCSLQILSCQLLEILPNLGNLVNLTKLVLKDIGVHEVPGLGYTRRLRTLEIEDASNLIHVDGLQHLRLLNVLLLKRCCKLQGIPSLQNLTELQKFEIVDCPLLSTVSGKGEDGKPLSNLISSSLESEQPSLENPAELRKSPEQSLDLSSLRNMKELWISESNQFTQVPDLDRLEWLESLVIENFPSLAKLPDLSGLKNLKKLYVSGCTQLSDAMGFEKLVSLRQLWICNSKCIHVLPDLSRLKNLVKLNISGCSQLTHIPGIDKLESLQGLDMSGCTSIEKFPSLSGSKRFSHLNISECKQFTELTGLEEVKSLTILTMVDCESIQRLPDLSCFPKLRGLYIFGCTQLTEVIGIEKLGSLSSIRVNEELVLPPLNSRVEIVRE